MRQTGRTTEKHLQALLALQPPAGLGAAGGGTGCEVESPDGRPPRAGAAAVLVMLAAVLSGVAAARDGTRVEPVPETVGIPAGPFLRGSDAEEREYAYRLDERAYGHSVTRERGWYDREPPLEPVAVAAFDIMRTPVTQAQYARFVEATGHPPPNVDRDTWEGYGLIHPWSRTRHFVFGRDARPPVGRAAHPVVLVSHDDARAYAAWLSGRTGQRWRLPTEVEWEKAARGVAGGYFPWGDGFEPSRLNSHDAGPFDTLPVGTYPGGASPFGMLDAAGQVYEWTATPAGNGRYRVKGGSWDDKGCGVCRPAAWHGRPADIRHILIGFRLVRER